MGDEEAPVRTDSSPAFLAGEISMLVPHPYQGNKDASSFVLFFAEDSL